MTPLLVTLAVLTALMVAASVRTSKVPLFRPAPSRKLVAMLAKRKMWKRIRMAIFRPLNPATKDGLVKRLWSLVPAILSILFVTLWVLTGLSWVALGWGRKVTTTVRSRRGEKARARAARQNRAVVEGDVVMKAAVARRYNMSPSEVQLAG